LKIYRRFLKPEGKIYIAEFAIGDRSMDKQSAAGNFISQDEMTSLLANASFKKIAVKKINELIYLMSAEK